MTIRQGRVYLLVADEREQLTAARQAPVVDSMISGPVKPIDILKSLGPAQGECSRTRVSIPGQTGCPVDYNLALNIESCRLFIPNTARFRILAAAVTGNTVPGRVIAFRLIRFQQE